MFPLCIESFNACILKQLYSQKAMSTINLEIYGLHGTARVKNGQNTGEGTPDCVVSLMCSDQPMLSSGERHDVDTVVLR